jgi:hypothetical protein
MGGERFWFRKWGWHLVPIYLLFSEKSVDRLSFPSIWTGSAIWRRLPNCRPSKFRKK